MKQLFLHIGLYKTGSTTLQAFFQKNRNTLRNYGYLYPLTGSSSRFHGHHNLAWLLRKTKNADPTLGTWQELHKEIETANLDKIVISSENFDSNNSKYINSLKSELKSYEVKIIVYVRRQDLRLESLYNQEIKQGLYSGDVFSFLSQKREGSDYYKRLEPWKQIFGIDNLIVRPLEKTQIPNICHDLLKIIGITDFNNFSEIKNQNIKLGRKVLEVLKLVNKIYENNPQKREKYSKVIANFTKEYWSDYRSYRLLSYSDSLKILEWYKQSNIDLAKEYLARQDGVLFYEELKPYENNNFTIEDLSKEELLTLILTVLK